MAGKRPAFQFYPGDWLRDRIAYCSIGAQGLWLRMMIVMHDNEPYGCLTFKDKPMPDSAIAQACGLSLPDFLNLLQELEAAGVPSRREDGALFCRRMVKDEYERQSAAGRMRNSRATRAQHERNATATLAQPEDEDEDEKEVEVRGGVGGNGDPWSKPKAVYPDPPKAESSDPTTFGQVVKMLTEFGFASSNAYNIAKRPGATVERVTWLVAEGMRRFRAGDITKDKACGFVVAGIRDKLEPDPGPAPVDVEAYLDAHFAKKEAKRCAANKQGQ